MRFLGQARFITGVVGFGGVELAGKKPERGDVFDRMGEDGKVSVEVIDLAVTLLESEF